MRPQNEKELLSGKQDNDPGGSQVTVFLRVGTSWLIETAISQWSRRGDLNPRPSDYESLALPLSYAGSLKQYFFIMF
jgi:hypothetical protein